MTYDEQRDEKFIYALTLVEDKLAYSIKAYRYFKAKSKLSATMITSGPFVVFEV